MGARLNKTQFQYTLNDADQGELNHWTDLFVEKFKGLHSLADIATDQLNAGPLLDPKFQYGPQALDGIYVKSSSGQQVPISTLVDSAVKVAPLVVNHTGQFPSVTISFNLAPGTAIGQAVSGIQAVEKALHPPLSVQKRFQGNAQAFGASLK